MQVLSLGIDYFSEQEYKILAVHTHVEDYHLVYQLNKLLKLKFKSLKEGLSVYKKGIEVTFSLFEYYDNINEFQWRLVANKNKTKKSIGLFDNEEIIIYLSSKFKKIDYFLITDNNDRLVLELINQISFVITSYYIEPKNLKYKDLLIF